MFRGAFCLVPCFGAELAYYCFFQNNFRSMRCLSPVTTRHSACRFLTWILQAQLLTITFLLRYHRFRISSERINWGKHCSQKWYCCQTSNELSRWNEVHVKFSCSLFHLLFCCYTENAASIGYSKGNYCLHGTQDTMQTSIKKLKTFAKQSFKCAPLYF